MPRHRLAARFLLPQAPPERLSDRVLYGFLQPALGARTLVSSGPLLRAALVPGAMLAAFCFATALATHDGGAKGLLEDFYRTFALLAPLPSVLLGRYYARLAARARRELGFAEAQACLEPIAHSFKRLVKQAALVLIGMAPVKLALDLIPVVGPTLVKIVAAAWGLHWVVVDAFDAARTLRPGQTLAELETLALHAPQPWFTRLLARLARKLPLLGRPLARFAALCDRLAIPWREESALIESHPATMMGFALSTALLLATPALNLLFRPIIVVGAVHLLGQLEIAALSSAPKSQGG